MTDLKDKVISATKWSVLSEVASKTITPIIFLVLAKILTPEDFGVVSVAILVFNFSQIIIDAGLTKTLIFKKINVEELANVVFWTNLTLSIAIYLVIFFSSNSIAAYFKDAKVEGVLKLHGLLIIITGISSVHTALFQKDLDFKTLFLIRFLSAFIPGLFSIPLAISGLGYWAIISGSLAGSAIQCIILWRFSKWRPSFTFNFTLLKEMIPFSKWVLLESFLYFIIGWGDSIIAGRFLGIKELGVYSTGVNFVNIIFSVIFSPLLPVLYSYFTKFQEDRDKLTRHFLKVIQFISFISLPIGIGLYSISNYVEIIVFNDKWIFLGTVIGLMALKDSIGWLFTINSEIYRSIGRPQLSVQLSLLHLLFIPLYIYSTQFGLFWFCVARITALLTVPPHILLMAKILNISKLYFWHEIKGSLMISIALLTFMEILKLVFISVSLANLIILIILGVSFYVLVTIMFNRKLIIEIVNLIKRKDIQYEN